MARYCAIATNRRKKKLVLKFLRYEAYERRRLPRIEVRTEDLGDAEFAHFVTNEEGVNVGQMSVTLLSGDGVYVRHIKTFDGFEGKKYGLSSAQWLVAAYGGLSLIPVRETTKGRLFWAALRQRSGWHLLVRAQVSQEDLRLLVARRTSLETK